MFGGYLKQSTAVTIAVGPFVDATDGFTLEVALTLAQADFILSKNGAAFAAKNEATTAAHMASGWYGLLLDATDTATLGRLQIGIIDTGARQVWREYHVIAANIYDSLFGAATDKLEVDIIQVGSVAANADNLARFALGLVIGTADSGSTTTLVDAALTQGDTDYFKNSILLMTSGTLAGQARRITAFTPASDTVTVAPAFTQVVGTQTYVILPQGITEADLGYMSGVAQSATDLKDFADDGYDPSTNKLTGLLTVDGLGTQAKADVNAEVLDVLNVDTFTAPAQGTPASTTTLRYMLAFLYKLARNKKTQTSTQWNLYNDDASTIDHKAAVSDDATTATKGEVATGP